MTDPLPPNPYDFSSPANADLFAGRMPELVAVDQFVSAVATGRAAHLLIHGRRGIGKTSLLGQVRERVSKRGVIQAMILLDDASAEGTLFFRTAITALATGIIDSGGLGGPGGEFEQALERALLGYEVEPGIGPLRVVQFAARNSASATLPDRLVAQDLAELSDAARDIDSPSLLLIVDEADKLSSTKVTVQRLRNLVITPGLISTILSGTDDLLVALDSALTPIGRHFGRIHLDVLADSAETRECLAKPLRGAGLNDLALIPRELSSEIHRVTRGRPFEVILVGHAMYRRLADRQDTLRLSDEVLEDVAAQLRPSPDEEAALGIIRRLEGEQLRLAAKYCVDPRLTLMELALVDISFDTEPTPQAIATQSARIEDDWAGLEQLGLAQIDKGTLRPRFGELGQLYIKYRAIRNGAGEPLEGSYADRLAQKVEDRIAATVGPSLLAVYRRSGFALESGTDLVAARAIAGLAQAKFDDAALLPMPLGIGLLPDGVSQVEIALVPFEINEDGFAVMAAFATAPDDDASVAGSLADMSSALGPFGVSLGPVTRARLSRESWAAWQVAITLSIASSMLARIWFSGSRETALNLGRDLLDGISENLMEQTHLPESGLILLNNLGFIRLAAGQLVDAIDTLERSAVRGGLDASRDTLTRCTLLLNMAAAAAGVGRYPEATTWAEQALELAGDDGHLDRPGALVPFGANPDWARAPSPVINPEVTHIARATLCAIRAASGDREAADDARDLAREINSPWAFRHFADVADRCKRPDLGEEARRLALLAPVEEPDDAESD
jgi:AAA ATPase domain